MGLSGGGAPCRQGLRLVSEEIAMGLVCPGDVPAFGGRSDLVRLGRSIASCGVYNRYTRNVPAIKLFIKHEHLE